MPIYSHQDYNPPTLFRHPHYSTIIPSQFRNVNGVSYSRERIKTPDNDFFDVDFSKVGSKKVAITLHGFEGNASRPYVLGMVKELNKHSWDVASLNYRGCSGTPNNHLHSYHSGKTDDIHLLVNHLTSLGYSHIVLIGYSLGGNLALKYMGENIDRPDTVKGAVGFSVPIELHASAIEMGRKKNWVYGWRFKKRLVKKIRAKESMIENKDYFNQLINMKSLIHFDNIFTAKQHGYVDAIDYYNQNSSNQFLNTIEKPTLLVNALNDSFLPEICYPFSTAKQSKHLFLSTPKYGGHCGFWQKGETYWSEEIAMRFVTQHCS